MALRRSAGQLPGRSGAIPAAKAAPPSPIDIRCVVPHGSSAPRESELRHRAWTWSRIPLPFGDSTLHFDHGRSSGGWVYVKVLWVIPPSYGGPVLIRGRQLDGTHWLGFDRGSRPLRELQIPPRASIEARGWRGFPSYTRVRAAGSGCYAYQIDGTTFSRVLRFRLRP